MVSYLNIIFISIIFPTISCSLTEGINRIINGTNAPEDIAPYMVSIRLHYNRHLCGGSIINPNTILTAAHCLTDLTEKDIFVVAGSTKLDSGGNSYTVTKFKLHEDFNTYTLQHDIALVFVRQNFQFSDKIRAIQLANADTLSGETLLLTGWGYTSYNPKTLGKSPNNLQLLMSKSISNDVCQSMVPTTIYNTQVCALNNLGQGACYADSGSPLVSNGHQVGIVSWAYPCATETPDVYTRVFTYIPWINKNIRSNM